MNGSNGAGVGVRVSILAAACAVLGLLGGCAGDSDGLVDVGGADAAVMPLEVGNSWTYRFRDNTAPGAPFFEVTKTIDRIAEITHDRSTIAVACEITVQKSGSGLSWAGGRLLRNEPGGLYRYGSVDEDGTVVPGARELVAPLHGVPGEVYETGPDFFMACVAADSLVELEFGAFRADVYTYRLFEGTVQVPDVHVVRGVGVTLYYTAQYTASLASIDFGAR